MPSERGKTTGAPGKRPTPTDAGKIDTVTCRHCRYERPAADARCHICGYPWPWLEEPRKGRPRK